MSEFSKDELKLIFNSLASYYKEFYYLLNASEVHFLDHLDDKISRMIAHDSKDLKKNVEL